MKRKPRVRFSVFITPAGGVGGEFPIPVVFYDREQFVKNYMRACRAIGQKVRLERTVLR